MKTFLECMHEAAEQIGWLKGEHFIEQLRGTQIDVLNKAADIYLQTAQLQQHAVMRPASASAVGGELLPAEGSEKGVSVDPLDCHLRHTTLGCSYPQCECKNLL